MTAPVVQQAQWTYITNNGAITITRYTGSGGDVIIPGTINGLQVTGIANGAFDNVGNLTSVALPASVTNIGDLAFCYCTSLARLYFKGNAPSLGGTNVFYDDNVTVYYLPGKTGWGSFGGLPTALWRPLVASVSAGTNQFGFNINWICASGMVIAVDACTNLTNPVWTPLATNTLTGDSGYFSDSHRTNYPARFYRIRAP